MTTLLAHRRRTSARLLAALGVTALALGSLGVSSTASAANGERPSDSPAQGGSGSGNGNGNGNGTGNGHGNRPGTGQGNGHGGASDESAPGLPEIISVTGGPDAITVVWRPPATPARGGVSVDHYEVRVYGASPDVVLGASSAKARNGRGVGSGRGLVRFDTIDIGCPGGCFQDAITATFTTQDGLEVDVDYWFRVVAVHQSSQEPGGAVRGQQSRLWGPAQITPGDVPGNNDPGTNDPGSTVTPPPGPVEDPTIDPVPTETLDPGESQYLLDGVPVPVEVDPNPSDNGIVVKGPDWSMTLDGLDRQGEPLNLDPNGYLVLLAKSQARTTGTGFLGRSPVALYINPPTASGGVLSRAGTEEVYVGTVETDEAGNFDGTVTLPPGIPPGQHTLQAVGLSPSKNVRAMNLGVVVKPWITLTPVSRQKGSPHDRIQGAGESGGIPAGAKLGLFVRFKGQTNFVGGKATVLVRPDGTFAWTRLVKPHRVVEVYVGYEDVQSNVSTWEPMS